MFTKCDARKKGGPTPAANIKAWKQEWLAQYEEVRAQATGRCLEEGWGRTSFLGWWGGEVRAVFFGRAGVWRHQLVWAGGRGGEGLWLGPTAKP